MTDFERIDRMMKEKGVYTEPITGKEYYTGYEYMTLYDWDQYFEGIIQLYLGWDTRFMRNGIEIFLDLQKENGHIQRSSKGADVQLAEHVKPFLAQIALLIYNRDGNIDFLKENEKYYYQRMKKYILYWLNNLDNYQGLAFWDSAPHTGMDNQHERAGYWCDSFCCGVDLASFLVRECRAFSLLGELLEEKADAVQFGIYAEEMAHRVRTMMWDEEDGFFYDIDKRTGEKIRVRYSGAFSVLWAGIATPEMAESMVTKYLQNPKEFRRGFLYPSLAASEPGYTEEFLPKDLGCCWRANTWIPVNYYIFQGLRKYGYTELAEELVEVTYQNVKNIGDREYYTTESKSGCGLNPFWGWSLLAYFMPYEAKSGYDPTEVCFEKNNHILKERD